MKTYQVQMISPPKGYTFNKWPVFLHVEKSEDSHEIRITIPPFNICGYGESLWESISHFYRELEEALNDKNFENRIGHLDLLNLFKQGPDMDVFHTFRNYCQRVGQRVDSLLDKPTPPFIVNGAKVYLTKDQVCVHFSGYNIFLLERTWPVRRLLEMLGMKDI